VSAPVVHLLDVNVLIALLDPAHVQHDTAHDWFATVGRHAFATTPITALGVLRIVGHARYPNGPGTPLLVLPALDGLRALPGHHFWPDAVSPGDPARFHTGRLLTAAQLTDSHLLALAVAHGGRLATLDRRLVPDAVHSGRAALTWI
jgi:toxin-antitoxin system PIN domain toxin